jgi:hypothetical protein
LRREKPGKSCKSPLNLRKQREHCTERVHDKTFWKLMLISVTKKSVRRRIRSASA